MLPTNNAAGAGFYCHPQRGVYYDPHLLQDVSFVFTALALGTYRLDFIFTCHEDLGLVGDFWKELLALPHMAIGQTDLVVVDFVFGQFLGF